MTFSLDDAVALAVASTLVAALGDCVLCAPLLQAASSNMQAATAV